MKKFIAYLLLVAFSFSFTEGIFANYTNKNNTSNYTTNNSNVIIYKNGVKINWKYYTKAEFEKLLQTAEKISDNNWWIQPRFAPAIGLIWAQPWTYYIIWIWAITVAKDWTIYLLWQVVSAWSWVYNKVVEFFSSSKSAEQEYTEAKNQCKPNKNNHKKSIDWKKPDDTAYWTPYSTMDFYDELWRFKKRRYFNGDWIAELDIHFQHWWKETHIFPHCHKWAKNSKWDMSPLKWYKCCQ